jgi:hypothetical protein
VANVRQQLVSTKFSTYILENKNHSKDYYKNLESFFYLRMAQQPSICSNSFTPSPAFFSIFIILL